MSRTTLPSSTEGAAEEAYASSELGGVVEMSGGDIDLRRSTYAVCTKRIAAEDLGLGWRIVGDLALVRNVRSVPIKCNSRDLILDVRGQFRDRVVHDSSSLA